jgi:signal transduction histidine kinase
MVSLTRALERYWQPALLSVAFLILIGIGVIAANLAERFQTDSQRVTESLSVQSMLANLLLTIRRAESGERGYIITDDRSYLEEYRLAETDARRLLDKLQAASKGNPARITQLADIAKAVDAKFDELDEAIALVDAGRSEDARKLVLTNRGRDLMKTVRSGAQQLIEAEGAVLDARTSASQATSRSLLLILLAGIVLILLIGSLSIILVQRTNRARLRAMTELESTNANLETIISHRTSDLTEANEEIQRFAYIVSHDLRSPLVNVMGFTKELEGLRNDILEELQVARQARAAQAGTAEDTVESTTAHNIDVVSKEFDEALGFIKASIAKMDRLINAILRLSREGRREFTPERIDMKALIENIEQTLSHQAAVKGTTINIGELPPVESDRLALEQVFSNLVDNALKYLRPDTPGQIDIGGQETTSLVTYEVRDNGRGIDAADHQRIFDLFRRAGTQDVPGEGIGLAHVRALVRRLGGYMGVSSEPGRGSIFTVTLPKRFGTRGERKTA